MIVCKYLSSPIDGYCEFLKSTNNALFDCDIIHYILIKHKLTNVHILSIDDLQFRINCNDFNQIGSFKLTYDDELTATDHEILEAIELEIIANNI